MAIEGASKHAMRLITGFTMGIIALACLVFGGIALLSLISIIVVLASREYVKILEHKGFYPSLKIILLADAVFAIVAYFARFDLVPLAFTFGTFAAFMWVLFKGRQPYIANVATTMLGFIYTGWFPLHLLFLRDLGAHNNTSMEMLLKWNFLNEGLGYVVFMFFLILLTDIGGFYFGRKFGKHKLAPVISPKKTIEGSIGGLFLALVGAFVVAYFIKLPWYHALIAGILVNISAQIGDLSESLIKRDAGVKDSGNSLPGHGGFLDRCDSFIFTIPIMYYYAKFFIEYNPFWNDLITFVKGIF